MSLICWMVGRLGQGEHSRTKGPDRLTGYLALSRMPGINGTLDERLALLATALAAELSGCRWCIDRSAHEWRSAGLPAQQLCGISAYSGSAFYTERERAALAFVEAASLFRADAGASHETILKAARQYLTESELAELTAIVAEHHCLQSLNSDSAGP